MEELVTVALDVMGGDHAPSEIIKGGVEAVNASKQVKVLKQIPPSCGVSGL